MSILCCQKAFTGLYKFVTVFFNNVERNATLVQGGHQISNQLLQLGIQFLCYFKILDIVLFQDKNLFHIYSLYNIIESTKIKMFSKKTIVIGY